MSDNESKSSGPRKLGTFGGVFVPNVLTILGVIMFLRSGWVVGQAGLLGALLILVLANAITLITSLSLSSISTNSKVGAGGAYFLISRSLGLEIGGSIGVPLFFAQVISVAFYLVGFTESLQFLYPGLDSGMISLAALGVFFVVALGGAGLVVKAQYFILLLLGLSLLSFFAGYSPIPQPAENLAVRYSEQQTFWTVFAIFFPAVTGIMAGVSMSGDLERPSQSIPRGTIAAVLVTFVIYAAQMAWLSINAERSELLTNNLIMLRIARVPPLIFVGLWAATLSSALASLAAAPRTLQALGQDRVVPRVLGMGFGPNKEPRIALAVATMVAALCIMIGDLNLIAPVISMFFLATYGTINIVAGLERLVSNPSYRPTFKTHWLLSTLGGMGCIAVMFLINAMATLAAIATILTVYLLLTRVRFKSAWGDMRSGLWFAITRFGLIRFEKSRQHIRNWRPVLLVLVGNPKARLHLVEFANWIEARLGFLFLAQIVTGDWETLAPRHAKLQENLEKFIIDNGISGVAKSVIAEDFEHGVLTLLQVSGLGQFEPNTVLLGWSEDTVNQAQFTHAVRRILELQKNLLVFEKAEIDSGLQPNIDVWWYAKDNGSFMLTLAHLIRSNPSWQNHTIRVLRIITDESGAEDAQSGTAQMLAERRIESEVCVIVSQEPPLEVIARKSEFSEICFVGLSFSAVKEQKQPLNVYADLIRSLKGNVFLSKSWQDLQY